MMDMKTQMRLTGLASGLDTDLIIQNLGKAHTVRIDSVKRDRTLAMWRQESYRNTISLLQNFVKSSFNSATPASNFRSSSAFAKFSYNLSVGGTVSEAAKTAAAKVLSVTANGDLRNFNQSVQAVAQLASKDTWSGSEAGLRGITSSGFDVNKFFTTNENGSSWSAGFLGLSVDGVSKTIQLDPMKIREIVYDNQNNNAQYTSTSMANHFNPVDGVTIPNFDSAGLAELSRYSINLNSGGNLGVDYFKNAGDFLSEMKTQFESLGIPNFNIEDYVEINDGKISFTIDDPGALDYIRANGGDGGALLADLIQYNLDGNDISLFKADYNNIDLDGTYVIDREQTLSTGTPVYVTTREYLTSKLAEAGVTDPVDVNYLINGAKNNSITDPAFDKIFNDVANATKLVPDGTYDHNYAADKFAKLLNEEIVKQFGSDYSGIVSAKNGELVFNKAGSNITIFDALGTGTQMQLFGFPSGGVSNNSVNSKTIGDLFPGADTFFQETVNTGGNISTVNTDRTIQINGKSIKLSASDTVSAMISKINNADAGVTLSYSSASDKFTLTSTQEGSANNVSEITDAAAQFFSFLGLGEAVEVNREVQAYDGHDVINLQVTGYRLAIGGELNLADNETKANADPVKNIGDRTKGTNLIAQINGEVFVRQSNTFQYEGMTYTFNSTYNIEPVGGKSYDIGTDDKITIHTGAEEPIEIKVEKNTTEIADSIKAFVDEYNTIVDHLNDLLNGKRDRDYKPLSDDEKKSMKDEDIKAYEDKAKIGIMSNEADLRKLLNEMRSAIYQKVEGVGLTMSDIGITTSPNWKEGGRLVVDDDKLKSALENRYDEVVTLFTKADTGIAQRLNKVFNEAVRTTTFDVNGKSVGTKGYLVEKAGVVNDGTQFNNTIQKQLTTYDEKINLLLERWYRQENSYYAMFARMETAMAKMQSQQNSLASLMAQQGGK